MIYMELIWQQNLKFLEKQKQKQKAKKAKAKAKAKVFMTIWDLDLSCILYISLTAESYMNYEYKLHSANCTQKASQSECNSTMYSVFGCSLSLFDSNGRNRYVYLLAS